eukprot:6459842-Amphidinium_carterae.2
MSSLSQVVRTLQPTPKRRKQYSDALMVAMHLISVTLTNRRMANKIIQMCASVAFQGAFDSSHVASWLPSASYLQERLVCFDAALMLLKRDMEIQDAEGGLLRYVWADSSVQGHRDWLQIKEQWIRGSDLADVFAAVRALAREDDELFMEERHAAQQTLESKIHVHMRIPVAKASGRLKKGLP